MEPQSSVSLVQLGGLMVGLVIVAVVFIGAGLWLTRRRNNKPAAQKPAQSAAKRPPKKKRQQQTRKPERPQQQAATARKKHPRREATPTPTREAAAPAPLVDAPSAPPGATELMRVYRHPADGNLIIQIDGEDYRTLGDIKQAGIEKPFLAVLRDLARTAKETGDQITRDAKPRTPQATTPAPDPSPARAPLSTVPPTIEELTGSTLQPQEPEPLGTFFGNMRRMVPGGPSETELEKPLGIADQIESVLQLKLLSSEAFRTRRIHVKAAPSGGVQIVVGDKTYEAVSDIEDEEVREFVQSAIQDWERQQG